MTQFRSNVKLLRKGILAVILWTVAAGGNFHQLSAQGHSAYVVQTLGSLFSIDIGTAEGIEPQQYYRLYRYHESAPTASQWTFEGIIYTQQSYPFLTVCKIVQNVSSYVPVNAEIIALYPSTSIPEDNIESLYQPRVFVQELPDKEIKRPRDEPSIQWNLSKKIGSPMGIGVQALYGYQNVGSFINENLVRYISSRIYLEEPIVTEDTETSIGQSFTLQKVFPGGFNGRFGYGHMVFKGFIRSELPPDIILPSPVPDDYIQKWDMTLKTVMHDMSFVLLRGGIQTIKDILNNKPGSGGFSFHWGFGVNFARIHYEAETKTTLIRLGWERIINDNEKLPCRWHWGAMGLAGISHNSGFGTIFIESGINWWKTAGLDYSYPARAGIVIYF